ncbi:hypothetical protein [Catenulispora pinisilvae]|uniref:hypothetical protein n=1 Tax=Catenulispora pinisilvae TaxID=2705253 RepID=UPI001891ECA9|nr:hypothetical protein [Catenulispora pinisilvae]
MTRSNSRDIPGQAIVPAPWCTSVDGGLSQLDGRQVALVLHQRPDIIGAGEARCDLTLDAEQLHESR